MSENFDLLPDFILEVCENLTEISRELKIAESNQNQQDKKIINSLFRRFHTIKGGAGMLGFEGLSKVAHLGENLLDKIRNGSSSFYPATVEFIYVVLDEIYDQLNYLEQYNKEKKINFEEFENKTKRIIEKSKNGEDKDIVFNTEDNQGEKYMGNETQDDDQNEYIDESQFVSMSDNPIINLNEKQEIEFNLENDQKIESKDESPILNKQTNSLVKVNTNLLDKIMNIVGELVLNRNQIVQFVTKDSQSALFQLTSQLSTITTELQTEVMKTRMQPIGNVLNKFEVLVRDVCRKTNKKANYLMTGKETELDRGILESINDPLTHIIRNAIDHGLETPEERIKLGRPEKGTIQINAFHEGGQVNIEIVDDGRGINSKRVAQKAIENGVITENQLKKMATHEIQNLIFAPGLSTAEKVTDISGRGVGMDVVKNNIESIGGSIEVQSKEGEGSTFRLKIPLTLAIIPALMVKSCKECFAIPQCNLVELVRLENSQKNRVEKIQDHLFLRLREQILPIFSINEVLNLKKYECQSEQLKKVYELARKKMKEGEVELKTNESIEATNIAVLNAEGSLYGIIVDEILDTEEIVVRPIGHFLKSIPYYSGATIQGDGRVSLILDPVGLYKKQLSAGLKQAISTTISQEDEAAKLKQSGKYQEFLIVSTSQKRILGIPVCVINRLEKFEIDKIEQGIKHKVIQYRDGTLPLIDIENSLHLSNNSIFERDQGEQIACVVTKVKDQLYGLVVNEISDIAGSYEEISDHGEAADGIVGTIIINNKTTAIIDIHSIIENEFIQKSSEQPEEDVNKRNVLFVDDSPFYRKVIEKVLREKHLNVITATGPLEAMEILKSKKIDLIISDIEMPEMNGFEFVAELMKDNKYHEIPMMAISSSTKAMEEGQKKGSPFKNYLKKLESSELLDKVDEYLAPQKRAA